MKPIWYFFQIILFVLCSPNAIFQVPLLWRNLGKRQIAVIHGLIFAVILYILYESTLISDLWNNPRQNVIHKIQTKQTKLELSPDHAEFQFRMGDGSK